jgi:glycosyltransferase involved in cell wall biosynthesis
MLTVVVPVYKNEESVGELIEALASISKSVVGNFEAVIVVDGSPDQSYARLREQLPHAPFFTRLISLSRNFGSFSAIRVGLQAARGEFIAVMAADLQEPPDLTLRFREELQSQNADVAFGVREGRADPFFSRLSSRLFWGLYRRFILTDMPSGGVDIFGMTHEFRDRLLSLNEANSSLVAQLFWLGGKRVFVRYGRLARQHGKSAWTLKKKLAYLSDSVFSFTDLPVRLLIALGTFALVSAMTLSVVVLAARILTGISVPGYTPTILAILFFGALNALGLGVVGSYAWRAFENTKARPLALIQTDESFNEESA